MTSSGPVRAASARVLRRGSVLSTTRPHPRGHIRRHRPRLASIRHGSFAAPEPAPRPAPPATEGRENGVPGNGSTMGQHAPISDPAGLQPRQQTLHQWRHPPQRGGLGRTVLLPQARRACPRRLAPQQRIHPGQRRSRRYLQATPPPATRQAASAARIHAATCPTVASTAVKSSRSDLSMHPSSNTCTTKSRVSHNPHCRTSAATSTSGDACERRSSSRVQRCWSVEPLRSQDDFGGGPAPGRHTPVPPREHHWIKSYPSLSNSPATSPDFRYPARDAAVIQRPVMTRAGTRPSPSE